MRRQITLLTCLLLPAQVLARNVTTRLTIEGMRCPACPPAVTKALKRLQGVKDIIVSAIDGTVAVVADESVSSAVLIEAIAKAGFSATVAEED